MNLAILEDPRQRRQYQAGIVEETLIKRPYLRVFTMQVLEGPKDCLRDVDLLRVAKECLKGLSGEDLRLIHD